ncbi:MAG: ABC transporter permease [Anaerolineales bacterium]|nr:MAG: ABC transporter permease [Anaerolineales bacterium]
MSTNVTGSAGWRHRLVRWVPPLVVAGLWEATTRLSLVDPMLLPPFSAVLRRGWQLLVSGRLLGDLTASAWRVLLGFGAAAILALPAGIALGLYPILEELGSVLLSALRPLSPPAWIPLAILWFGIGDPPALFIIFVGTFFSLLLGTLAATKAAEPQLIKAALTLGASRRQSIWYVILPRLLPALLTQARIGLGLAWMCVIAAEMVAVQRGVGFLMIEARNLFRTEDVIVGMIAVAMVGLATDRLLLRLEKVLCRWRMGLEPSRLYAQALRERQP